MSQLPVYDAFVPLSSTVHSAEYSAMKSYSHTPFAKPATHVHRYACDDTVVFDIDSEHVAPFWQGPLRHSFTSISQLPE
jgi:hypothetical protein